MDLRWPDGRATCPTCASEHVIDLAKVRRWKCYEKHPSPQFTRVLLERSLSLSDDMRPSAEGHRRFEVKSGIGVINS
jgi:hypothetical protein